MPIEMKVKGQHTSPQITCDVCGKPIRNTVQAAVHYNDAGTIKFAHGHPELCTLTKPIDDDFPYTMDLDTFFVFLFKGDHRAKIDWKSANERAVRISNLTF